MTERESVFLEAYSYCTGGGKPQEVRYEDLVFAIGIAEAKRKLIRSRKRLQSKRGRGWDENQKDN